MINDAMRTMPDLAERGAEMSIASRTHGRQAVRTTIGLKIAVRIDDLLHHVIDALLDPTAYAGLYGNIARQAASRARKAVTLAEPI